MAQHTPGPWTRGEDSPISHPSWIIGAPGAPVAECCHYGLDPRDYEANATLIAAAPELLAALESCLAELAGYEMMLFEDGGHDDDCAEYHAVMDKAQAAIAKATGGAA